MKHFYLLTITLFILIPGSLSGQRFPGESQNIEYLAIFGPEASGSWGDDNKVQVFFVQVPEWIHQPLFLRVFDPDTGGAYDESNQGFNTRMKYTLYGGPNCHPAKVPSNWEQQQAHQKGRILDTLTVSEDPDLDGRWFSFRALDPAAGQLSNGFRLFKIVVEGLSGNDGNLCHFFLSSKPDENRRIPNATFFSYELCFRLGIRGRAKLFPYLNEAHVFVHVFDYDQDGKIDFRPPAGPVHEVATSGDGVYAISDFMLPQDQLGGFSIVTLFPEGRQSANNTVVQVTSGPVRTDVTQPYRMYSSPTGAFHPRGRVPVGKIKP